MKTKAIFLTFALSITCWGQDAAEQEAKNPEITKIDARLAELAQIWKEDTAVINRITNFKRKPVQEGSSDYYTCLKSSQRIQKAEEEAKALKSQKAALDRSLPPASGKAATGASENSSDIVKSELEAMHLKEVSYDESIHGPRVKGAFIGMSIDQFAKNALELGSRCYPDQKLTSEFRRTGPGFSFNLVLPGGSTGLPQELISAGSDSNGKVTTITFVGIISKAFGIQEANIEEFTKSFGDAYSITLEPRMDDDLAMTLMGKKEFTINYRGTTKHGVLVKIFALGERGMGPLRLILSKTASEKEIKGSFD